MEKNEFYTLRGYDRIEHAEISAAMEDYLEMICRLTGKEGYVRIKQLACLLNVTPSSSSKMVTKLREKGYVEFEPYGVIRLTSLGNETGKYLLYRHELLHRFFCMINQSESELDLVEKIEHYFDKRTIAAMERFLNKNDKNIDN